MENTVEHNTLTSIATLLSTYISTIEEITKSFSMFERDDLSILVIDFKIGLEKIQKCSVLDTSTRHATLKALRKGKEICEQLNLSFLGQETEDLIVSLEAETA